MLLVRGTFEFVLVVELFVLLLVLVFIVIFVEFGVLAVELVVFFGGVRLVLFLVELLLDLVEGESVEFGKPLTGAGQPFRVHLARAGEPFPGLFLAVGLEQRLRVGVAQARSPRLRLSGRQVGTLQKDYGRVRLTEVTPCSGGYDPQLDLRGLVQFLGLGRLRHLQRLLRAAQATLAVGHDGPLVIRAGDPPRRAQFRQRFGVTVREIGGKAERLACGGQARRKLLRGAGVGVCLLGVLVDEPTGHHEVTADELGLHTHKRPQFGADVSVEVRGVDVVRQRKLVEALSRLAWLRDLVDGLSFTALAVPEAGSLIAAFEACAVVPALEAAVSATVPVTVRRPVIPPLETAVSGGRPIVATLEPAAIAATVTIAVKATALAVAEARPVSGGRPIVTALESAAVTTAVTIPIGRPVIATLETTAVSATVPVTVRRPVIPALKTTTVPTAVVTTLEPTAIAPTVPVTVRRPVITTLKTTTIPGAVPVATRPIPKRGPVITPLETTTVPTAVVTTLETTAIATAVTITVRRPVIPALKTTTVPTAVVTTLEPTAIATTVPVTVRRPVITTLETAAVSAAVVTTLEPTAIAATVPVTVRRPVIATLKTTAIPGAVPVATRPIPKRGPVITPLEPAIPAAVVTTLEPTAIAPTVTIPVRRPVIPALKTTTVPTTVVTTLLGPAVRVLIALLVAGAPLTIRRTIAVSAT